MERHNAITVRCEAAGVNGLGDELTCVVKYVFNC